MKRTSLLIVILLVLLVSASGQVLPADFYRAVNMVETGGRTGAILGDKGKALGPLQIHYTYWLDSRVPGSYSDCSNYTYSCKVMNGYFKRHAQGFVIREDYQSLARIHNGGPQGHLRAATKNYWLKVRKYLTN